MAPPDSARMPLDPRDREAMLIVQITDMHITSRGRLAYRKVDTAAALARCVAHVNGLQPRPTVVLLTGDLVDMGRPEEYALLRELIAPLAAPVYMIPGNHDDRTNLRAAFPDHRYLFHDDAFIHYVVEEYPLRLIGLDTTIPGAKEGELCDRRLAWLDARLAEAPDRPTLVFMHHPPFLTGIAHMDVQNCRNGAALGGLVERHGQVTRILCGHVHRPVQIAWHGVTASIGPSPSHSVALDLRPDGPAAFVLEPGACELHYWHPGNGLVSHLSFVGAFGGPYPFFEADGRLIQ